MDMTTQGFYTRELKDRAIYLYTVEKMGCYSISKQVGFSEITVKKHLRKDGIAIRGLQEALALRPAKSPEEKAIRYIEAKSGNSKKYRQNVNEKRQQFLAEQLIGKKCVDCGYDNIIALEFDHRDPTQKDFTISKLLSKNGASKRMIALIEKEIAKCDVVCSNCHTIRTAKMFGSWRLRYAGINQRSGSGGDGG